MVLIANYMYFVESFGVQDITDHAFWAIGVRNWFTIVEHNPHRILDIYSAHGQYPRRGTPLVDILTDAT